MMLPEALLTNLHLHGERRRTAATSRHRGTDSLPNTTVSTQAKLELLQVDELKRMLRLSTTIPLHFVLERNSSTFIAHQDGLYDVLTTQKAFRLDRPMAPATAQEIQAAAHKFLGGGSAEEICRLANQSDDNRKQLVASAGVVDKLVELTLRDKPAGDYYHWAFYALCDLVQLGQVAQDAIAKAHDGAIFAWLAGPQNHGQANFKNTIITNFTKDHPTNTLVLQAVRRGDVASLIELVFTSLQSGDMATALLAMNVLVGTTRGKGAASTISDSDFASLASVMDWDPTNGDANVSTVRGQVESLLVEHLPVQEDEAAFPISPLSVADHLKIIKSETSDSRNKLLAVLRLKRCVREDQSAALGIVSSDAFPAVADVLRCVNSDGVLVAVLRKHNMHLLESMAQVSTRVRDGIWDSGAVTSMIHLSRSASAPKRAAALDVLRVFLRDENHTNAIARTRGIPFLVQLCRHDMQHASKQDTPTVNILTTLLVGHEDTTNDASQRKFVGYDGSIDFLVRVLKSKSGDEVLEFTKKLSSLVPLLLKSLQEATTKRIDALVVVLEALEIFSRIPKNQILFQRPNSIKAFTDLLKKTNNSDVKAGSARILTNICYKNNGVAQLIVACDAAERLVDMINSNDTKLQTSALMAIRNLASCDINRAKIGSLELFPRVVELLWQAKTMKQKEAAAAVLGNLAFLRDNREKIAVDGGIGALVDFLDVVTTLQQVETAAAALWVVVDDQTSGQVMHTGAGAVLQKAVEGHPQHDMIWAKRLRTRLMLVGQPVSVSE